MQIRLRPLVPLLVGCLGVGWCCCAQADTPSPGADSPAQRLGPVPEHVVRQVASRDGCHVAMVASRGSKWIVVVDGVAGPEYDEVTGPQHEGHEKDGPIFSSDGSRVAYVARQARTWLVVLNGVEGSQYDRLYKGGPVFSRDGKRVAYLGDRQSAVRLVVDGVAGAEYDGVATWSPGGFSPDGRHVVYVARQGDKKNAKDRVVVDGVAGPEYDGIGYLAYGADGQRMAYWARAGQKELVVVDGAAGPEYDSAGHPRFSSDGRHVAYAAQTGKKQFVVCDGRVGAEYDEVITGGPAFQSDGSLEYLAIKEGFLYRVRLPESGSQ